MSSVKRSRWDEDSDESDGGRAKAKALKKSKKEGKKVEQAKAAIEPEASKASDGQPSSSSVPASSSIKRKVGRKEAVPSIPCRSVENYERLNFIDQGTYGMVFRAKCLETNEVYALKQVKLGDDVGKTGFPVTAFREVNILLALNHPNIVKVREMVVGSTIDKIFMVMEYCENDLKACMQRNKQSFSTSEIKQLMIQLISAVEHMHSRGYLHRDLKTSNLLYSNRGFLCVCDFGLARKFDEPPNNKPYTFEVVTLWYRAPEVLLGSRLYGAALDVWSIGCIFGELLLGDALLPGQGEMDQIHRVFSLLGAPTSQTWPSYTSLPHASQISWGRYPKTDQLRERFPRVSFAGAIPLSDQGLDLMRQLLTLDPAQRISAANALQHPWITTEHPLPRAADQMPTFASQNEARHAASSSAQDAV